MSSRRNASAIHWVSPSSQPCSLRPMSGGAGLLEIELEGDLVAVHSRNCLLRQGDDEDGYRELAEFEFTVSLQRCQIDWSISDRKEDGEIERSAYFQQ